MVYVVPGITATLLKVVVEGTGTAIVPPGKVNPNPVVAEPSKGEFRNSMLLQNASCCDAGGVGTVPELGMVPTRETVPIRRTSPKNEMD
jgi:hypothetical protein